MSARWTVTVSGPLNDGVLVTLENGVRTDNGVVALRGFDPVITTPPCTSKLLNLYARQDTVEIPSRGIVTFALDDTPIFWGVVVTSPPVDAPGAGPFDDDRDSLERITVVSGAQLLKDSVVGPLLIEEELDVKYIALAFCETYAHPALTVSGANFAETGGALTTYYKPTASLANVLDELLGTVTGGGWWCVDAAGEIHLAPNIAPLGDM